MAFKVNYGFQRAERERAKQAKKEAKLREKKAAAQRPADQADAEPGSELGDPAATPGGADSEGSAGR